MPMGSWILILTVYYNTPAMTVSPGLYATKDACMAAAMAFEEKDTAVIGATFEARCLPGPNIVLAQPTKKK